MWKFLKRHKLLTLKALEEMQNLHRPVTMKQIGLVIQNLPPKKCPGLDGFTGDFYETFKEESKAVLTNSSKK